MPRGQVAELLRKIKSSQQGLAIDSLCSIPKLSVKQAQVVHKIEKRTVKSRGVLKIQVEISREKKNSKAKFQQSDVPITVGLVLGSYEKRLLLAYSEITINRSGNWSIEKELEFDWNLAKEDSEKTKERRIVLRLLLDSVRGMDSEIAINLIQP